MVAELVAAAPVAHATSDDAGTCIQTRGHVPLPLGPALASADRGTVDTARPTVDVPTLRSPRCAVPGEGSTT